MVDVRRLRTLLAIDVVATVLVGIAVYVRPELLAKRVPDRGILTRVRRDGVARWIGFAVASLGTVKGFLYLAAMLRIDTRSGAEDESP